MKAKELLENLGVRKVIFNGKTTIVYLTTGEKGVANCGEHDEFDPVVGIAMAYLAAESQGSKMELKQATDYIYKKGTFENKKSEYMSFHVTSSNFGDFFNFTNINPTSEITLTGR